ncbi:MAG TPA: hypothetical protein VN854_00605, partial [Mycoplasmatales bacterium]|nr:hypothetical protein [Mycoplasmatales bacterium]
EQKDEEYVKHLWEKFKEQNLVNSSYKKRIKFDKRLNKHGIPYKDSITYRFQSCSLPYFQKLMRKWYTFEGESDHRGRYRKKTKIVPKDLKLTPIVLAYWIMDDGCFSQNSMKLYSQGFSKEDNFFLVKLFRESFGIEISLHRDNRIDKIGERLMIYIPVKETKKIVEIVRMYLIPSRSYKIGL